MIKNPINRNNIKALYGGLIATAITASTIVLVGSLRGWEAKQLIEISLPRMTALCNTIALASATILALLLTLLSIGSSSKTKIERENYGQILTIAKWDTIVFIGAIIMFQLFNVPVLQSEKFHPNYYSWYYWSAIAISSILSGSIVSVILLLYNTVRNLINIISEDEHRDNDLSQ